MVLALLVVGAAQACGGTDQPSVAPSTADPAVTVEATSPGGFPVGIALGNTLFDLEPDAIAAQLDDAVAAGANWIRVDISWAAIQPEDATDFNWEPMDRIVDAAAQRHLHVLGILDYTPPWARAPGCETFICPPADDAAFAAFAGTVAQRYAQRGVDAYEIWNEPNLPVFWSTPDPVAYRDLLTPTVAAVRDAAPHAEVVLGGLAPNGRADGAIAASDFLQGACDTGACAAVDAIGYHPYTFPHSPEQPTEPPNAWARMTVSSDDAPSIRSVLQSVGLGDKPLWLTEFGAPTGGDSPTAVDGSLESFATPTDHVTEDWQAHIIGEAVALASADRADFGSIFVYTLDDTDDAAQQGSFGLRRTDGSAKPAYVAFQSAALTGEAAG